MEDVVLADISGPSEDAAAAVMSIPTPGELEDVIKKRVAEGKVKTSGKITTSATNTWLS